VKRIKSIFSAIVAGMLILTCFPSEISFGLSANQNNKVEKSAHLFNCNENEHHGHDHLSNCNEDDHHCHDHLNEGKDVKIAIFDSGITNVKTEGTISFVKEEEISDHGNLLARNLKEILHDVKLYDVRILDNNNEGNYSSLAKGVDWAIENDIDIISLSVVGFESSEILENAINKAEENNILVIAAAGNESNDKPTYPASYPTVISVGALNENSEIASYSNYGNFVDIYKSASSEGTSFATITAVACAANMMESNPDLSAKEIRKLIVGNKIKSKTYSNSRNDGKLFAAACSHTFSGKYTITKNPTCTATGTKVGKCSKCGKVLTTVTIAALGHSYGSWTTPIQATCTISGFKTRKCSRCGVAQTQTLSALGHSYGSWTTTKNATCTSNGSQKRTCKRCGAAQTQATAALGHSYGSWTTPIQATCTSNGFKTRKCSRCGTAETQTLTATGHTSSGVYTVTKAATCTATGTKVIKCTKCGAVTSTATIAALGHSYGSWTTPIQETCTTNGFKMRTCSRCGVSETQTLTATGHKFNGVFTVTKKPTCVEEGTKVGKCDKCGAVVTTVSIPVTDHSYSSWITPIQETCTTNGFKMRTCTVCGVSETQTLIATGHKFNGVFTITKEPTCIEEGTKVGKCDKCGAVVTTVSIPKLGDSGHKLTGEYTVVKEPTCIEPGIKAQICTICKAQVNKIPISPLGINSDTGHDYTYTRTKAPTSTRTGEEVVRCLKCGKTYTRTVPKVSEANYTYILKKPDANSKYGYVEFNGVNYPILVEEIGSGPVIDMPRTVIASVKDSNLSFDVQSFISGFYMTSDSWDLLIELGSQAANSSNRTYFYMDIRESSDGTKREAYMYMGCSNYEKAVEELGVGRNVSLYERMISLNAQHLLAYADQVARGYYEKATGEKPDSGFFDTYDLILSLDERRENTIYTHNLYVNSSGKLAAHPIPYLNDKLYIAKRNPWSLNITYDIILDISYLLHAN
jgi:hypothetical protein